MNDGFDYADEFDDYEDGDLFPEDENDDFDDLDDDDHDELDSMAGDLDGGMFDVGAAPRLGTVIRRSRWKLIWVLMS